MSRLPLVLLHAWPLDARMWRAQLPALRAEGETHALDLPGFGNAPAFGGPQTMDAWAEVLADDLRARGVDRAVFAGCSMGGYAALALLRRFPDLVGAIALVNSRASADTPEQLTVRAATIERISNEGTGFVVEDCAKMVSAATRANRPDVIAALRVIAGDAAPEALSAGYQAIGSRPDSTALLTSGALPVAIVAGAEDPVIALSSAQALVAEAPGASFSAIEGAGHFSPMENPDAVTAALRSFWTSLGS